MSEAAVHARPVQRDARIRMASVIDRTATAENPKRIHEVSAEGKIHLYTFQHGVPLDMPLPHAQKLIPISTFEVTDDKGTRLLPTIGANKGYGEAGGTLGDDECIAKLEELTLEALLCRVSPLPGGEDLNRNSGKTTLVNFIIASRKKLASAAKPQPAPAGAGEAQDFEESDMDMLDKLAPKDEIERL